MTANRDPREDALLVAAARRGDRQAFAALYERYIGPVYDFLARMLGDRSEAEDVAQETFIRAMQSLGGLQAGTSFRGWLFTIARNTALNRIERQGRVRPLSIAQDDGDDDRALEIVDPHHFSDPAEAAGSAELVALVWEAAAGLDPKQYSLLDLHVRQGLDSAEIAGVLGVTKNNAYVMVNRLKKAVEESIAAYVMARTGRRSCDVLDAELARLRIEPSGITPTMRKAVERHVARCDTCQQTKGALVSPLSILGALLPVPLAPGAQERIFGEVRQAVSPATSSAVATRRPIRSASSAAHPALLPALLVVAGLMLLAVVGPGSPLANAIFNGDEDDSAALVVRLTDVGGAPLAGVGFGLQSANGNAPRSGMTDAEGLLRLSDLPAGDYTLSIAQLPDGFEVAVERLSVPVTLDAGETLDLNGAFQAESP